MKKVVAVLVALLSVACTNEQLKYNTSDLGGNFGSVMERQVLINLSSFIDNPWTIPGHLDVGNGQLQVTDTLGFGLKYPYTHGINGVTRTKSSTQEFDLNIAQRANQDWWSITPVTDSQDLRRLRALYHYAVCGDWNDLVEEWQNTGVELEATRRSTIPNKLKIPNKSAAATNGLFTPVSTNEAETAPKTGTPGLKSPSGAGGKSEADTEYFVKLAHNLRRLKGIRWLYWTGTPVNNPVVVAKCPALAFPGVPPDAVPLGAYGGRELWTTQPALFSDFVLIVLASIPNTLGYPGSTPKSLLAGFNVNVH